MKSLFCVENLRRTYFWALECTLEYTSSIEIITLEINLGKEKLLVFGAYKPPDINNSSFLNELYNAITFYSTLYKNCILLGYLNTVRDNTPW